MKGSFLSSLRNSETLVRNEKVSSLGSNRTRTHARVAVSRQLTQCGQVRESHRAWCMAPTPPCPFPFLFPCPFLFPFLLCRPCRLCLCRRSRRILLHVVLNQPFSQLQQDNGLASRKLNNGESVERNARANQDGQHSSTLGQKAAG